MAMTEQEFERVVGRAPVDDDMERVNCERPGKVGHYMCGWCSRCELPVMMCGHMHPLETK